jgi:iduronate 2-sulfatase
MTVRHFFHILIVGVSMLCLLPCVLHAEGRPNVLFIAIDDLRNDLGVYGAPHAQTPLLDSFAKTARVFSHHFVQVPTCGASRCALMRGCYPIVAAQVGNNGIKQTQAKWSAHSLPMTFRQSGYQTLALGKITHYPGGLTGKGWAEGPEELPGAWDRAWVPKGPWSTPEDMMHGYADGNARKAGQSPAWEANDGPDETYPDAWVAAEAVRTLKELATQKKPWFFGVGFFKPHLPFAAPKKWHDLHRSDSMSLLPEVASKPSWPSTWHNSGEFRNNYGHAKGRNPDNDLEYALMMRRAYAASISYMDEQVGKLLAALKDLSLEEDTIVVLWSDHGFLLGEHSIWGKHCLYDKALRSPLMIRCPGLTSSGSICSSLVETVDLLPTMIDLCSLPALSDLDGKSLRPQLFDAAASSEKPAYGFWSDGQRTVRTDRWRLIVQPTRSGSVQTELFDYQSDPDETRDHSASNPEKVRELLAMLERVPGVGQSTSKR